MKNPKVQRLLFTIEGGPSITYDNPDELEFANDIGHFSTLDGILSIEPSAHFVRESEARSAVEPFLNAWEASSNLQSQSTETINFKFVRSEIIDLNPPQPGESQTIYAETGGFVTAFGTVSFHVTRKVYPSPRDAFELALDAQSAYSRWLAFKEGHEPLQSMAYFVLTMLEGAGPDKRGQAAAQYKIDKAILNEIGRLASTKGSALTARKASSSSDLTGTEQAWLERAIPLVVIRIGERIGGAILTPITMAQIETQKTIVTGRWNPKTRNRHVSTRRPVRTIFSQTI